MGKKDKHRIEFAVAMKNLEAEKKARNSAEVRNVELEEALATKTQEMDKAIKNLRDERIKRDTALEELRAQVKLCDETKKTNEELKENKAKIAKAYKNLKDKWDEEKKWFASEKVKDQIKALEREKQELNDQVAGLKARNRSLGSDNDEDSLEGALTNWTEIDRHMEGIMKEDFGRFQVFWAKEVGPQKAMATITLEEKMKVIFHTDEESGIARVKEIIARMIRENDYLNIAKTMNHQTLHMFHKAVYRAIDRSDNNFLSNITVLDPSRSQVHIANTHGELASLFLTWTSDVTNNLRRDIGTKFWDEEVKNANKDKIMEMRWRMTAIWDTMSNGKVGDIWNGKIDSFSGLTKKNARVASWIKATMAASTEMAVTFSMAIQTDTGLRSLLESWLTRYREGHWIVGTLAMALWVKETRYNLNNLKP